jgi:hypothetical protein
MGKIGQDAGMNQDTGEVVMGKATAKEIYNNRNIWHDSSSQGSRELLSGKTLRGRDGKVRQ